MTIIEKLKEISAFLKSKGIENSAKEAEILITEALCINKPKLYSGRLEVSEEVLKYIDSLTERRAKGEPIQYIIGHVDFYGLKVNIGRGVLIPRPETELLVEETIKELKKRFTVHGSRFTILDLCTGSGCIALALAKSFPEALIYGVDTSEEAIKYAKQNALENNIKNALFLKGNLFEPVNKMVFDCIVSNPPYIKTDDIKSLQREIRDYEPIDALNGGKDGLDFYRWILRDAHYFLKENGIIILEIGYDQADSVLSIAIGSGFKTVDFIKDYAGIKRICIIHN